MIDRTHLMPVAKQCQLLQLSRSTAYYRPVAISEEDLAIMRCMDELHLEYPFAGSRMLRDLLRRGNYPDMGRKRGGFFRHTQICGIVHFNFMSTEIFLLRFFNISQ